MTIPILHSRLLEQHSTAVVHGFTTRTGGISPEPYASLNLAFHVGDHPVHVVTNRRILLNKEGLAIEQMVCAQQVHGNRVALVTVVEKGQGAMNYESAIAETDGLITKEKGLVLALFFADCVPILLYDPIQKAVGVFHAGWRGTAFAIAAYGVKAMKDKFGSNAQNLIAAIGPAIGGCCYQISEDVEKALGKTVLHPHGALVRREGRWYADLPTINKHQLQEAGVLSQNIDILPYCTCCRTDLFFSHRREKGRTGRQGAFIALR